MTTLNKPKKKGKSSVGTCSETNEFAKLFERSRRSPHYWCEIMELYRSKKQRMCVAREIAKLVRETQKNSTT